MDGYKNQTNTVPPSRDEVFRLYVTEGLSCKDAGREIGLSHTNFYKWLKRYEIPIRTKKEARAIAKPAVYSDEALDRMRARAAAMREKITPESYAKQSAAMRGRPSHNKGKKHSEEHKQKLREAWARPGYKAMRSELLRGEKSPNWRGGVKPEISARLDRWEWREIRKQVYARDRWICQDCGKRCKNTADSKNDGKAKIQAHHIVSRRDGGTDDLANLITLCMSCHHKRERAARLLAESEGV